MNVRVYPIKKSGKSDLLANASIEIEGIVIKGFKILNGKNDSLWISWPNQKGTDGKYYDQVYALDKTLREDVEDAILDEYNTETAKGKGRRGRR